MRKEYFFPFWDELEAVIPIVQTQQQNHLSILLVSLEIYHNQGFLFNVNVQSDRDFQFANDLGRLHIQAKITDNEQKIYNSFQALATCRSHFIFQSRMVLASRFPLTTRCSTLYVSIGPLE